MDAAHELSDGEMEEFPLTHMDDYSDELRYNAEGKACSFIGSTNNNVISEASLSSMLSQMEDKDWAILTAYRVKDDAGHRLSKKENIVRNRKLRGMLDQARIGVHLLVGHWRECSLEGVDYKDCPDDKLEHTIERSYFVSCPSEMGSREFYNMMLRLMTISGLKQDAIVVHFAPSNDMGKTPGIYLVFDRSKTEFKGTDVTLGKIAQAYSQHISKVEIPFVFEGMEQPASVSGMKAMHAFNILWFRGDLQ